MPENSVVRQVGATLRGIAMRKAAEARDHIPVPPSIVGKQGVAIALFGRRFQVQGSEQGDRTLLRADVPGVFQRLAGEYPLQRRQPLVASVGKP